MRKNVACCAGVRTVILSLMITSASMGQVRHADHYVKVGDISVRMIQDAQFFLGVSLLSGIGHDEAMKLMGGSDSAWTPANAYLVRMPNYVVLVDAGVGKYPGEDSGHLLEGLKKAGVDPAQVDLILITHFHFDHIGGLTSQEGKRVFPKAIVRVSKAENDFWMRDTSLIPVALRDRALRLKAILAPYMKEQAYRPFAPDEEPGHDIKALAAHGHTPGHMVYSFSSKGKTLWCVGDLIHFGAIQFGHPTAGVSFDSDGPMAVASRMDLFKRAAALRVIVAASHLPAMVQLEEKRKTFVATPVEVQ